MHRNLENITHLLNDMQIAKYAKNPGKIHVFLRVRVYSSDRNSSEKMQKFAPKTLLETRCILYGIFPRFRIDFGPFGDCFGTLLAPPGSSLAPLRRLLGSLGHLLGASWTLLGRSWTLLGRSWDVLGGSWAALGTFLGAPRRFWTIRAPFLSF